MIRAYIRTSTGKQDTETQRHAIRQWAKQSGEGQDEIAWYIDEATSGVMPKDKLDQMIRELEKGDWVVVTELSRLTRSGIAQMVTVVDEILKKKAKLVSISQQLDFSSSVGKLLVSIFGWMAEIEYQNIKERNKRMQAARKAAGVKLGRKPKLSSDQVAQVVEMFKKNVRTKTIEKTFGVSRQVLYSAVIRAGYSRDASGQLVKLPEKEHVAKGAAV